MSKIFINYRRQDSAASAGRIYDRLAARFGADSVFMDVDKIDPGVDFVEAISEKIALCQVLIVLIGKDWLSGGADGRRLDDPNDLVRLEILAAYERKIRIIPVLVGGASVPREDQLPDALKFLVRRNAIEIPDIRFHMVIEDLIQAIEKIVGPTPPTPQPDHDRKGRFRWLIVAVTAIALLGGGALIWSQWWGSKKLTVPNLVTKSLDEAKKILKKERLNLGSVETELRADSTPADAVLRQSPASGTQVENGRAIDVVVAKAGVKVPKLVGLPRAEAEASLDQAELTLGTVTEQFSEGHIPGQVLRPKPSEGTIVAKRTRVDLTVVKAPSPPPSVPKSHSSTPRIPLPSGALTIGVFRPGTSQWFLRTSASAGIPTISFAFGSPGDIPVVGDWDGSGKTGIGVFRPTTPIFQNPLMPARGDNIDRKSRWLLRTSASGGDPTISFAYGSPEDIPVVGDWDGSGKTGIGVFRRSVFDPATAEWLLRTSASAGDPTISFAFGSPGDIPVVGDWDGSGKTGIGVFRRATARWLLRTSASGGDPTFSFTYGSPGDIPVVGDWDGSGKTGIGVFRPATAEWLLRTSASGGNPTISFSYGSPKEKDIPVARAKKGMLPSNR